MQIKIRAWDSINKKMLSWEDLLSGPEFEQKMREPEKYGLNLMRYTGYEDATGQEVYEGDILFANTVIEWGCCTAVRYTLNDSVKSEWGEFVCGDYFLSFAVEQLDAIVKGNIYENPELMEE